MTIRKESTKLAPYQSKGRNFDWRLKLKEGDKVDYFREKTYWGKGVI